MSESDFEISDFEENPYKIPLKYHIVYGSIAGIAEHMSMYPIDTCKTYIQSTQHAGDSSLWKTLSGYYLEGGLSRLYRGATVLATGIVPAHALYFSNYEMFKRLEKHHKEHEDIIRMASGATCALLHDVIMTPTEMMKQRMQLCQQNAGFQKLFSKIQKHEGWKAFYRSFIIQMSMNMPQQMAFIYSNEKFRDIYKSQYGSIQMQSYFMLASLSNIIAVMFTQPMDVIKTKLATQNWINYKYCCKKYQNNKTYDFTKNNVSINSLNKNTVSTYSTMTAVNNIAEPDIEFNKLYIKYNGLRDAITKIYAEKGIMGFYSGFTARVMITTPGLGLSWMVYEFLKNQHFSSKNI